MTYTREFFAELQRKIGRANRVGGPGKHCANCGVGDDQRYYRVKKDNVRLALVDPKQPPNDAANVDFFCTRCRRPSAEWQRPRRPKPQELPQLF